MCRGSHRQAFEQSRGSEGNLIVSKPIGLEGSHSLVLFVKRCFVAEFRSQSSPLSLIFQVFSILNDSMILCMCKVRA